MERIIQVDDQYYILATSSFADDRTRVIKEGETFGVFDRYGDILPLGMGEQGVYHEGTRFLSRLELLLSGKRPFLLSSGIDDDNLIFSVDLANPDMNFHETVVPRETMHIYRSKHLWNGVLYEYIRLKNFNSERIPFALEISFGADFADIFEVRGQSRATRGSLKAPELGPDKLIIGYQGLDDILREMEIRFSPEPDKLSESKCVYNGWLDGKQEREITISFACVAQAFSKTMLKSHRQSAAKARKQLEEVRGRECEVSTSDQHFDGILHRSISDLRMMMTRTEEGYYPYAGVPWYSAPFGRDGIITALQTLWINPEIGRGVLDYLSRTQATEVSLPRDAEPGKIIHEVRNGEMALLGEVPFHRYYGSVDSTPLYVLLATEYVRRTGDEVFLERIWPNIERALEWIDSYGDMDGDGFVEYARKTDKGLFNQGWKDSWDSVRHRDGTIAEGPIALCEVQGYVYAAKEGCIRVGTSPGHTAKADRLLEESATLKKRFEHVLLDGGGGVLRPGPGREETAVQGADVECRALPVFRNFKSGTGSRGDHQAHGRRSLFRVGHQDPFHQGGVLQPHVLSQWIDLAPRQLPDRVGIGAYGRGEPTERMLGDIMEACAYFDLFRLPELFCGFKRRQGEGPTRYPVACSPQAWASGAVYLLLQACLGMHINGRDKEIRFKNPSLPAILNHLEIRNLHVGKCSVDLFIKRHLHDVSIYVTGRTGPVSVHIMK
jgi:glycogen debranching enzyme